MRVVSRPALGSVTAKQAFPRRAISGGSMRAFCSSVPKRPPVQAEDVHVDRRAPLTARRPDSAIACIMIAASVMPRPAPPYSSGMAMPSQPLGMAR